jgi:hypothetical protein
LVAVLALIGSGCSESPDSPSRAGFAVEPADTTIDLDGEAIFRALNESDKPLDVRQITASSSNAAVSRPCGVYNTPMHICALAPGSTTLTFKYVDGRTGTATMTVRPARVYARADDQFVAGYSGSVFGRVTDRANFSVTFRSSDTTVARVFRNVQLSDGNKALLELLRPT